VPPGEPTGMNQELPGPCTEAHRLCGGPIVRGIPSGTPHPGEGSGVGRVNTGASVIQVITANKSQRVRGVGQQAPEGGMSSLTCGNVDQAPPGRQQAPTPTDSGSGTWEPRPSPAGNARRQASRWVCGWRRSEAAKASGHAEERGSHVASRRQAVDFQRVFHETPTSGKRTRVHERAPRDIGAQGPLQDWVAMDGTLVKTRVKHLRQRRDRATQNGPWNQGRRLTTLL
jgi:hypothetical protein